MSAESADPNAGVPASVSAAPVVATPVPSPTKPTDDVAAEINQLSPEEQMARFEQALKETDWGHQPC